MRAPALRASHQLAALAALASATACAHCGEAAPSPAPAPAAQLHHEALAAKAPATPCPAGTLLTARGACVPLAWHCSPTYYGSGDGCDCDCGVADPDCTAEATTTWCYAAGKAQQVERCGDCTPLTHASCAGGDAR